MIKFMVNEMPEHPRHCPACSFRTYTVPFCNIIDRTCLFDDEIGKCEILMSMDEYNEEKHRKERMNDINKLTDRYHAGDITPIEFNSLINLIVEESFDKKED